MSRVIAPFTQFFDGAGDPLVNGWLRFLETGTNNSHKNTYADADETIPNANPLQLDAEGRCPSVFGQGIYRVILYENNPVTHLPGTQIQNFDPVLAEYTITAAGGNFAEWVVDETYQVGSIVVYNGDYYRSVTAFNIGQQPDIETDDWEQIEFLRFWNTNVTYSLDDVVIYGSQLYFSLQNMNQGNIPLTEPTWWDPVGSGTTLLNWEESGTTLQPVISGYDLGGAGNTIGTAYITSLGILPTTPAALPTTDYEIANKIYVDTETAKRVRHNFDWVPGTYYLNDQVRDDNWTMIANTTTEDRPAPQPSGDAFWVRDEFSPPAFSVTSATAPAYYVVQRYEFVPAFAVRGVRIQIPTEGIGLNVEVWAVFNPVTQLRIFNVVPGFEITEVNAGQWIDIPIGSMYVEEGTLVDMVMVFRPATGAITFTHEWAYSSVNGDPGPGQIYHQKGGNADQIRVHEQDSGLVDRTANLNQIHAGSVMEMDTTGAVWEVLSTAKTGDVYTFVVDPGAASTAGTSDFTFTYFADSAIYYNYNTDLFVSDSRISGFVGESYDPVGAVLTNDGYGIDIEVQNLIASADWDVISQPPLGSQSSTTTEASRVHVDTTDFDGALSDADNNVQTALETIDVALNYPQNGNLIINPIFDYLQRYDGSTPFTTSGGFSADRKRLAFLGSSLSVVPTTGTTLNGYFYSENGLAVTLTPDSASTSYAQIQERIENVGCIHDTRATINIQASIPIGNIVALELAQNFGSGGSTTVGEISGSDFLVGTGADKVYTIYADLPSISGKTIGTDNYLFFKLWLDAGSDFNDQTNSMGHQPAGTIIFYAWQVRPGIRDSIIEIPDKTQDLLNCYHYYTLIGRGYTGVTIAATAITLQGFYITPMRVTPVAIIPSDMTISVHGIAEYSTTTAVLSFLRASFQGMAYLNIGGFTGLPFIEACSIRTGAIGMDAEL